MTKEEFVKLPPNKQDLWARIEDTIGDVMVGDISIMQGTQELFSFIERLESENNAHSKNR